MRMPDKDNFEAVVEDVEYAVRRLTPIECARLQGFPDDWCAGVPHSDSAEYKLWGNGIALPSILPMMQNAVALMEREYAETIRNKHRTQENCNQGEVLQRKDLPQSE